MVDTITSQAEIALLMLIAGISLICNAMCHKMCLDSNLVVVD
jgi:hypothetical protein